MEEHKVLQAAPIFSDNLVNVFKMTFNDYQSYLTIAITLLIIFIATVIFWKNRRGRENSLLLMGINEAGKTALFIQLVHKKYMDTYTSMSENRAYFHLEVPQKKLRSIELIDVPGYDKLRCSIFEKVKYSARAIIFLVDGSTFVENLKDVTECLYCLLIDEHVRSRKIPLLVVCNKMDLDNFKSKEYIKTAFEKEINHLRQTRASTLQSTDGHTYSTPFIGKRSKDFAFKDDRNVRVDFVDGSVTQNIEDLKRWVLKTFT